MRVLLVGSGAREHAIAEALCGAPDEDVELYAFMGNRNPGIMRLAEDYVVGDSTDVEAVARAAADWNVDFAVVGPEDPLAEGVADRLEEEGVPTFGPKRGPARIEWDKGFARELMEKYDIPGRPEFGIFEDPDEACDFIDDLGKPVAVKPAGLTGGKGVKVVGDQLKNLDEAKEYVREIFEENIGGIPKVIIEEKCVGEEYTIQAYTDGEKVIPTPAVQDHPHAYEGDKGPITGGMGSYSCPDGLLPFITEKDYERSVDILERTVEAIREETGEPYRGVLYGQFMLTAEGPVVIEFNCRYGDPEAMNILPITEGDVVTLHASIAEGSMEGEIEFLERATVCKYVVPEGYPESSEGEGDVIEVDEECIHRYDAIPYYASVNLDEDGKIRMTSSRALAVVGIGDELEQAEEAAESAIRECVSGERIRHRSDIGKRETVEKRVRRMKRIRGES
ncbi:phosphoribosylamine--glycine ligase [Methanopyrus sp.]